MISVFIRSGGIWTYEEGSRLLRMYEVDCSKVQILIADKLSVEHVLTELKTTKI